MDWKSVINTVAPTVASALLGPLGGVAVSAIGSILGIDKPTQDSIAKAITSGQMTPEQVSKLRELELQYQEQERERGFKYAELQFKDTADARAMMVQTKAVTPAILTWIVVVLVLGFEGALLFGAMPLVDGVILGRIMGTLDAALMLVLGFWCGSSHGSTVKSEQIERLKGQP